MIGITSFISYIQNLNCIDFSDIINTALSGLFSIIAILSASYALITRYVEKEFCGMPVTHLWRYKIIWQIIPFVYLFIVYVLIIITDYSILLFTGLLLAFLVYLCIYLYLMLAPIFNKNKYYKALTSSLSKQIHRNKQDLQEIEYYIIETIKSINNENDIPSQVYEEILKSFKKRVKGLNQISISLQLLHLVRLLFYDDAKFFVEVYSLDIPLEHKYIYINILFEKRKNLNIHSFCIEAKKFLTRSLKEYIKLHSFDDVKTQVFNLLNNITVNFGLNLLLLDIYNADINDLKYIDILYIYLTTSIRNGIDLNQFISTDNDKIFIAEFKEIIEGKKKQFEVCNSFINEKINIMEMVIKLHRKEMKGNV